MMTNGCTEYPSTNSIQIDLYFPSCISWTSLAFLHFHSMNGVMSGLCIMSKWHALYLSLRSHHCTQAILHGQRVTTKNTGQSLLAWMAGLHKCTIRVDGYNGSDFLLDAIDFAVPDLGQPLKHMLNIAAQPL